MPAQLGAGRCMWVLATWAHAHSSPQPRVVLRPCSLCVPPHTLSPHLRQQELGELLDIKTLPTFVLLRAGAEAARLEGVPQQRPARKLAQAIRQHLLGQQEVESGADAAASPVKAPRVQTEQAAGIEPAEPARPARPA